MDQGKTVPQNFHTLGRQQSCAEAIRQYLSERYETPPLAHVHSYGCQQSVYDGERFKGVLAELGYGFTDDIRQADLILVLDNGTLAGAGTHEQLLQSCSVYREICDSQLPEKRAEREALCGEEG